MDLKYVARQLLRRPGHTLAVIACLVIGLVASVGTFSVITSVLYGDRPGIAGRRSLARVFLRYDSPTASESGGRRIVTAPLSFNDFALMRELPADSALDAIGAEGDPADDGGGQPRTCLDHRRLRLRRFLQDPSHDAAARPTPGP